MSCLNATKTFPLSPGEYTIKAVAAKCYLICDPIVGIRQDDTEIQIPVNTGTPNTEPWNGGGQLNNGSKFVRVESVPFEFDNSSINDVKEIRIESKPIRYVVSYTDSADPNARTWTVQRYFNACCDVDDRAENCPAVQDDDDGIQFSATVLTTDDFVQEQPDIPPDIPLIDTWLDPNTGEIWHNDETLCDANGGSHAMITDDITLVSLPQNVLTVQYDPDEIVDSGSDDINVEEVPPA